MSVTGKVVNGSVVLPPGTKLPEGAEVRIETLKLAAVPASRSPEPNGALSPREALRRLQAKARLSPQQAQQYLNEVYDERSAAEAHRSA